jgi:hypothetical protein
MMSQMIARNRLLYQRRATQINQIFILPPSLCNIAQVTFSHHVALLTGRVQDSFGGSELSFSFLPPSASFPVFRTVLQALVAKSVAAMRARLFDGLSSGMPMSHRFCETLEYS